MLLDSFINENGLKLFSSSFKVNGITFLANANSNSKDATHKQQQQQQKQQQQQQQQQQKRGDEFKLEAGLSLRKNN